MGKRKKSSRKPTGPKKREPLPTTFRCLFCNHEKAISVKMDKKAGTGHINCKVCGQEWSTGINFLSAPVDVYADWEDACDDAAKKVAGAERDGDPNADSYRVPAAAARKVAAPGGNAGMDDDEMDGFIEQDEMEAENDYGDDE